jgi:hypothetical protein
MVLPLRGRHAVSCPDFRPRGCSRAALLPHPKREPAGDVVIRVTFRERARVQVDVVYGYSFILTESTAVPRASSITTATAHRSKSASSTLSLASARRQ